MDPSIQAVAAQLSLTVQQVLSLMSNPSFPPATSGSGLTAGFNTAAINAFQTLWTNALSRGWKISNAALATAPIAFMAANTPGPYYQPALTDPLFDNFP